MLKTPMGLLVFKTWGSTSKTPNPANMGTIDGEKMGEFMGDGDGKKMGLTSSITWENMGFCYLLKKK